jgi:hypothetical protein
MPKKAWGVLAVVSAGLSVYGVVLLVASLLSGASGGVSVLALFVVALGLVFARLGYQSYRSGKAPGRSAVPAITLVTLAMVWEAFLLLRHGH